MRLLKDLASEAVNPYAGLIAAFVVFFFAVLLNICAALVD